MRIKIEDKEFEVDIEAAKRLGLVKEVSVLVAGQVWRIKNGTQRVLITQPIYDKELFSAIALDNSYLRFKVYSDEVFNKPSTMKEFTEINFFDRCELIGFLKNDLLESAIVN